MRRIFAMFFVVFASAGLASAAAPKKLIQWGWGEPGPKFMRDNAASMEEKPFDGFVFHLDTDKGENFTKLMWGQRKFEPGEFSEMRAVLQQAHFSKLSDRFLRVNVMPGDIDWFDDAAWSAVISNGALAAQIAHESGAKGLLLDIEQYGDKLFDYKNLKMRGDKSFATYEAKAHERGLAWVKAVGAAYPDMILFLSLGYNVPGAPGAQRESNIYGLAAGFYDGILEGMPPQMRIIDGREGAYGFREPIQFQRARTSTLETSAAFAADPSRYKQKMEVSFGVWMDAGSHKRGWLADYPWFNYYSPEALTSCIRLGFAYADEYVWLYSEKPLWWTNENLSDAYIKAVADAHPK